MAFGIRPRKKGTDTHSQRRQTRREENYRKDFHAFFALGNFRFASALAVRQSPYIIHKNYIVVAHVFDTTKYSLSLTKIIILHEFYLQMIYGSLIDVTEDR